MLFWYLMQRLACLMQNQKGIGAYYVYHNIISYRYVVCVCPSFMGLLPMCKIASSQLVSWSSTLIVQMFFIYFDYGIIYLFLTKLFYMHLYYVGLVAYSCSSCCDSWDSHPSVQHSPCILWWIQVHKIYFIDNYLLLSVSCRYFYSALKDNAVDFRGLAAGSHPSSNKSLSRFLCDIDTF